MGVDTHKYMQYLKEDAEIVNDAHRCYLRHDTYNSIQKPQTFMLYTPPKKRHSKAAYHVVWLISSRRGHAKSPFAFGAAN